MSRDDYDEDREGLHDNCPCCGHEYDEIDYEYQICHLCGYDAEDNEQDLDPNDSRNL